MKLWDDVRDPVSKGLWSDGMFYSTTCLALASHMDVLWRWTSGMWTWLAWLTLGLLCTVVQTGRLYRLQAGVLAGYLLKFGMQGLCQLAQLRCWWLVQLPVAVVAFALCIRIIPDPKLWRPKENLYAGLMATPIFLLLAPLPGPY